MMKRIWRLPPEVRDRYDLSSLETVWHLAEPCPVWLKEAWLTWLGPERVVELYAGTEAQVATVITGTEWLAHKGSVGRPINGEIMICDPTGEEVPTGEHGEVWLRSGRDTPTYRYVGAEARTREGGWESLGDMGHVDAEGYLYLGDRVADMILTGGANVYPAEVEAVLQEHPAVRSCAVIGLPDEDRGNRVHAIVEADPAEVTPDDADRLGGGAAGPLQGAPVGRAGRPPAPRRRRQGPPQRAPPPAPAGLRAAVPEAMAVGPANPTSLRNAGWTRIAPRTEPRTPVASGDGRPPGRHPARRPPRPAARRGGPRRGPRRVHRVDGGPRPGPVPGPGGGAARDLRRCQRHRRHPHRLGEVAGGPGRPRRRAGRRAPDLLHGADQGPGLGEVLRPRPRAGLGPGGDAHRRRRGQRRGAGDVLHGRDPGQHGPPGRRARPTSARS